jgi:hypothetical protein
VPDVHPREATQVNPSPWDGIATTQQIARALIMLTLLGLAFPEALLVVVSGKLGLI